MTKKRRSNGSVLVEVLIAFLIVIIAISITLLAANNVIGLEREARIKSDIYNIAYSYAETLAGTKEGSITTNQTIVNYLLCLPLPYYWGIYPHNRIPR